jgi:hypothetical protein
VLLSTYTFALSFSSSLCRLSALLLPRLHLESAFKSHPTAPTASLLSLNTPSSRCASRRAEPSLIHAYLTILLSRSCATRCLNAQLLRMMRLARLPWWQPQVPMATGQGISIRASAPYKEEDFDAHYEDPFECLNWCHSPRFMKPLASARARRSWVYRYG